MRIERHQVFSTEQLSTEDDGEPFYGSSIVTRMYGSWLKLVRRKRSTCENVPPTLHKPGKWKAERFERCNYGDYKLEWIDLREIRINGLLSGTESIQFSLKSEDEVECCL